MELLCHWALLVVDVGANSNYTSDTLLSCKLSLAIGRSILPKIVMRCKHSFTYFVCVMPDMRTRRVTIRIGSSSQHLPHPLYFPSRVGSRTGAIPFFVFVQDHWRNDCLPRSKWPLFSICSSCFSNCCKITSPSHFASLGADFPRRRRRRLAQLRK